MTATLTIETIHAAAGSMHPPSGEPSSSPSYPASCLSTRITKMTPSSSSTLPSSTSTASFSSYSSEEAQEESNIQTKIQTPTQQSEEQQQKQNLTSEQQQKDESKNNVVGDTVNDTSDNDNDNDNTLCEPLSDILELDRLLPQAAMLTLAVYLLLLVIVYWVTPANSFRYLSSAEQYAAMFAASCIGIVTVVMILPYVFLVKGPPPASAAAAISSSATTKAGAGAGVQMQLSGIVIAAIFVQLIACCTNIILAFGKVPVVVDQVTRAPVYLIRWCEWVPLSALMTFLSLAIDVSKAKGSLRIPILISLAQALSCLCGMIFPFVSHNFHLWLFVMFISCITYASMFPRCYLKWNQYQTLNKRLQAQHEQQPSQQQTKQHKQQSSTTTSTASFVSMEYYDRIRFAAYILLVCTVLWSCLVFVYFCNMVSYRFYDTTAYDPDNPKPLAMITDTLFDVVAKGLYMKLIVDVHVAVFDKQGRVQRQLLALRRLMSVLWDTSSDVILLSVVSSSAVATAVAPATATSSASSNSSIEDDPFQSPTAKVTSMLSPSFFKLIGVSTPRQQQFAPKTLSFSPPTLLIETVRSTTSQSQNNNNIQPHNHHGLEAVSAYYVDSSSIPYHDNESGGGARATLNNAILATVPLDSFEVQRAVELIAVASHGSSSSSPSPSSFLHQRKRHRQEQQQQQQQQHYPFGSNSSNCLCCNHINRSNKSNSCKRNRRRGQQQEQQQQLFQRHQSMNSLNTLDSSNSSQITVAGESSNNKNNNHHIMLHTLHRMSNNKNKRQDKEYYDDSDGTDDDDHDDDDDDELERRCEVKVSRHEDHAMIAVIRDLTERHKRFKAQQQAHFEAIRRQRDAAAVNRFTRHEVKNGLLAGIELCDSLRNKFDVLNQKLVLSTSSLTSSSSSSTRTFSSSSMMNDNKNHQGNHNNHHAHDNNYYPGLSRKESILSFTGQGEQQQQIQRGDEVQHSLETMSGKSNHTSMASVALASASATAALALLKEDTEKSRKVISEMDKMLHEVLDTVLAEAMARDVIHEVYKPRLERLDVKGHLLSSCCNYGLGSNERFPLKIVADINNGENQGKEGESRVFGRQPNPMLQQQTTTKNLKSSLLPYLLLDPQLLRYIHRNAFSNACKYGKANGRVETTVEFDPSSKLFRMCVINEPGRAHDELLSMGPLACEAVFAQGTRLHRFSSEKSDGEDDHMSFGDGAWIMQKCAKTLGGDCKIEFRADRTAFMFECPAEPLQVMDLPKTHDFEVPPETLGIGIDDSAVQRRLMGRILQHIGVEESKRIVIGKDPSDVMQFRDVVMNALNENPDSKILLLVDENLDFSQGELGRVTLSGSFVVREFLDSLTPAQEARVFALVRSANDSAEDVSLYLERVHAFFPKAPVQRERVREILAPLWADRFQTQSYVGP